jgi:hypothetical protein
MRANLRRLTFRRGMEALKTLSTNLKIKHLSKWLIERNQDKMFKAKLSVLTILNLKSTQ